MLRENLVNFSRASEPTTQTQPFALVVYVSIPHESRNPARQLGVFQYMEYAQRFLSHTDSDIAMRANSRTVKARERANRVIRFDYVPT